MVEDIHANQTQMFFYYLINKSQGCINEVILCFFVEQDVQREADDQRVRLVEQKATLFQELRTVSGQLAEQQSLLSSLQEQTRIQGNHLQLAAVGLESLETEVEAVAASLANLKAQVEAVHGKKMADDAEMTSRLGQLQAQLHVLARNIDQSGVISAAGVGNNGAADTMKSGGLEEQLMLAGRPQSSSSSSSSPSSAMATSLILSLFCYVYFL